MRFSIRTRILLALNAMALAVTGLTGWVSVRASDRAVERRLLEDAVRNTAALVERLRLPLSSRLLASLAQIFDAQLVVWQPGSQVGVVATLPEPEVAEFARLVAAPTWPRQVRLGGTVYRLARAEVEPSGGSGERRVVLCLLMEAERIQVAQRQLRRHMIGALVLVLLVATLLGGWLAHSIAKPLRTIVATVNRLARQATEGSRRAGGGRGVAVRADPAALGALATAPPELAGLLAAVDGLLAKLGEMQEALGREEKLVALGRFAAVAAHELRNPLSGIAMNAQLLSKTLGPGNDGAARSVAMIVDEARRLRFFLDELLSAVAPAPADGGATVVAEPAPACAVGPAVERVLEFMAPRLFAAKVEASWSNAGCPPLACTAIELEQLLFNLLMNAIDAMPAGGTVELLARARPDGAGELRVIDTGGGLTAAAAARLFEPFVTSKPRGIGLGLYACKRIVDRRGGCLDYLRDQGRTVFRFILPSGSSTER